MSIFNDKFKEVVNHEGAVAIVTWANNDANVANTWNSYLRIPKDGRLLIPAAGMKQTEENIVINNKVKITLGSKEVEGMHGPGAGFSLEGTAEFIYDGPEYESTITTFPFASRVLVITVQSLRQTV